jgi:hypothetical protein
LLALLTLPRFEYVIAFGTFPETTITGDWAFHLLDPLPAIVCHLLEACSMLLTVGVGFGWILSQIHQLEFVFIS